MARILLIDDDDSVRGMLRLTLTHFGHAVTEARDGREGLGLFQPAGIDLVITDIVMPDKEGLETVRELRKKDPAVKIIAMSGGGRMGKAIDYLPIARRLGAAKVLAKPFSTEVLIATVNELLAADSAAPAVGSP